MLVPRSSKVCTIWAREKSTKLSRDGYWATGPFVMAAGSLGVRQRLTAPAPSRKSRRRRICNEKGFRSRTGGVSARALGRRLVRTRLVGEQHLALGDNGGCRQHRQH